VVTPVLAALAGAAHVAALTGPSRYASVEAVTRQTRALEYLAGTDRPVEIVTHRRPEVFAQADIVTNLGFVRPIDSGVAAALKPTAVVPLMCEAWEYRPGDVDLEACRQRGIPVVGTNEDFPGLEVFAYTGWLALKMLFEAQVEAHKSRLLVLSGDKFGRVIAQRLERAGAAVKLLAGWHALPAGTLALDAVIVADYTRADEIVGPGAALTAEAFARRLPGATLVQYAGRVDVAGLMAAGVTVYPGVALGPHRMAQTLAALGPRPVIELHAAGLKVGELGARARLAGRSGSPDAWPERWQSMGQTLEGAP
jgi:hypothetical protein